MSDGARPARARRWRTPMRWRAAIVAATCALAAPTPGHAENGAGAMLARPPDTSADDQPYSYYYVPHLSELNQLVGYIFRSGLVRMDAPTTVIRRYAAYSCEGTLFIGDDAEHATTADVDWSAVTGLRAGPADGLPSLVIERDRPAVKDLVLYFPDATIRYQMHQALAVLVTECRPNRSRSASPQ